jgi:hypothetical protein
MFEAAKHASEQRLINHKKKATIVWRDWQSGLAPTFAATAVLSNFHIFHVHPQVLLGLSSQVPFGDAETAPVGPGAQWEMT